MRPLGTALLTAALLATAACGDGTATSAGTADAPKAWHGCSAADVKAQGKQLASVDLDADGIPDTVWLVADGSCAGLVATASGKVLGADPGVELDPASARGLTLEGDDGRGLLLVSEKAHPRGGAQPHVYGVDGTKLGEVTADGKPLLPFVATDGGGTPVTATCPASGGIAVLSARTHEPPGIVLAWDVTRTSYRLDGLEATSSGSRTVLQAAADPTLRKQMPHLFDGSFFTGC